MKMGSSDADRPQHGLSWKGDAAAASGGGLLKNAGPRIEVDHDAAATRSAVGDVVRSTTS